MSETVATPTADAESGRVGGRPIAAFLAAVSFLTRLPVGGAMNASDLGRAASFFPLVGAMIGAVTATAVGGMSLLWPTWIAVLLALAVEALLTGALHEDGFADCCDAFGGGWDREKTLAILKDSRLGTYGALGLGLAVAVRAAATIEIVSAADVEQWHVWSAAIIAAAAVGRWAMVLAMVIIPRAPDRESLATDIVRRITVRDLAFASLWLSPFALWWAWNDPIAAAAASVAVAAAFIWFARLTMRRLGGITGDGFGLLGVVTQNIVLLAAASRLS